MSTLSTLPCRHPPAGYRTSRTSAPDPCSYPPKRANHPVTAPSPAAVPSVGTVPAQVLPVTPRRLRSPGGQAAEDDRGPQGEAVAPVGRGVAGQLGDPAQPVADRVGVDETHPAGRLKGRP